MEPRSEEPKWDNSSLALERLREDPLFEEPHGESPTGLFAGRRIIARDTPINGGVYVGSGQREAIVVDDTKYPDELNAVYNDLLVSRLKEMKRGDVLKTGILKNVFDVVKQKLKPDEEATRNLITNIAGNVSEKDAKIPLNSFIKGGVGICRHQALLAGYLLERLKIQGFISPKNISIDRNSVPGKGGHAWVRYENSDGTIYIIDPAQNFVGTLEEAKKLGTWPYERPQEGPRKPIIKSAINAIASRIRL